MPRGFETLSWAAREELARSLREGLTTRQTRLRLAAHGAVIPERTVARHLAKLRAEQRRVTDLEAIGRGLGSVQIGAAGTAEILRASAPDWRRKQAGILRDLLQRFLEHPTGEIFSGLAAGMFAFLLSANLSEALEGSDG